MTITEYITHPLVNAFGWTLLHSIWQILLITLVWRFFLYLTRHYGSGTRYSITLFALIAVPLSFVFTFIKQWDIYKNARQIVSIEFSDAVWPAFRGGSNYYIIPGNYPDFISQFEAYTHIIFWIYLTGLILLSVRGIISYVHIYSLRKYHIHEIPVDWIDKITGLARRAGLKKAIPVLSSSKVTIPVVTGFLKPLILLPIAMFAQLSPVQVEIILLHELCHIRRNDHYINMLQNFLEIIFFFHPAFWWISKHLRNERENRVDEWVVNETSNPLSYAQALVNLEENRIVNLNPVLAATHSYKLLLLRINNIFNMKKDSFNYRQIITALMVILAVAVFAALISPDLKADTGYNGADNISGTIVSPLPGADDLFSSEEEQDTSKLSSSAEQGSRKYIIHLDDGTFFQGDSLSPEIQEQLQKALEEARIAIGEARIAVFDKLNSEEFRQEMEKMREELHESLLKAEKDIHSGIDTAGLRVELKIIREDIRKAMEESGIKYIQSEEFQQEMQKLREEILKAIPEEMEMHMQSEEFQEAMKKAQEEIRKALDEIDLSL